MEQEKDCAFQYATQSGNVIADETGITLDEAKELWNSYYDDAAKRIHRGENIEMVIWHNMTSPGSYNEYLVFIENDAISDGKIITEPKPRPFTKFK